MFKLGMELNVFQVYQLSQGEKNKEQKKEGNISDELLNNYAPF